MKLGTLACAVGKGLVAGLAGTAAITLSQAVEKRLRHREDSPTPARAFQKLVGMQPVDLEAESRVSNLVHWGYGTGWGAFRGALATLGVPEPAASVLFGSAVQGAAFAMVPAMKLAPPVTEWPAEDIAIEVLHHAWYAAVVGLTYEWLSHEQEGPPASSWPWILALVAAWQARTRAMVRRPMISHARHDVVRMLDRLEATL
jgi:hypothetical protein